MNINISSIENVNPKIIQMLAISDLIDFNKIKQSFVYMQMSTHLHSVSFSQHVIKKLLYVSDVYCGIFR